MQLLHLCNYLGYFGMNKANPTCSWGDQGAKVTASATLFYLPWFFGYFEMYRTNPSCGHGDQGAKVSAVAALL